MNQATTATTQPIIHTEGLSKAFNGVNAVSDLSLEVPSGVLFGFIGPSGCGKTTSIRLLLGIAAPDAGDASVLDCSPQNFGRRERKRLGYMPQQFLLYPELSVWENLDFAASLYGVPLRRNERLQELLSLVELSGHERKKVRDLSGGMQRRLSLAAAIIHNPQLIFLDEPTAGIDPILRRKFWDYFQHLKDQGHTLFITTQYVGEAAYCDYVGVMSEGRLLMVAPPDELRRHVLGGAIIHLHPRDYLDGAQIHALQRLDFVVDGKVSVLKDQTLELIVHDASEAMPLLLNWCQKQGIEVESAGEHVPLFDDVFVELMKQNQKEGSND